MRTDQMTEGKLGIKDLKEFLAFSIALGNAIGSALEDGKINITDAFKFFPALRLAQPAFDGIENVWPELQDLDQQEHDELLAYVVKNFKIPQARAEAYIEVAFEFGLGLVRLIATFKKG